MSRARANRDAAADDRRRVAARSRRSRTRTGARFAERLAQWQQKALREAKLVTDWADPNEAYEAAARALLPLAGRPTTRSRAAHRDLRVRQRIAPAGAVNSTGPDIAEAHRAGRAGHLSGHRVLGFQPGRSRQPPAGRLRAAYGRIRAARRKRWRRHGGRAHQAGFDLRTLALRRNRRSCSPTAATNRSRSSASLRTTSSLLRAASGRMPPSRSCRGWLQPCCEGEIGFAPDAWKDTTVTLRKRSDADRCVRPTSLLTTRT